MISRAFGLLRPWLIYRVYELHKSLVHGEVSYLGTPELTCRGQEKMAAILHTTFSKGLWPMEMSVLNVKFTEVCSHQQALGGSRKGLAPYRRQAITRTNDHPVHWRMNTSLNSNMSINSTSTSAAIIRQWIGSLLVQIMTCRLFGAKPLSKAMLGYCQLDP